MKKIFTLITLFAFLGGGNLYADEYTVTFKDCGGTSDSGTKQTTIDGLIATGGSIFSEVAADNAFQARADRGVKLGSGSKPGSMEFTLSTKLNIQTIKFKARKYNDTETSITVNGKAFTELTGDFDEYTIELNGAETEKISISTPEKRAYITSLTILTPGGGEGGGGETGLAEIWRADDLIFENNIVQSNPDGSVTYNVTEISNPNFFSVPQDKKVYPEGTYAAGGVDVLPADGTPITMKSYELTIKTPHVTLHAVSTPNTDASESEGWQLGGGGNTGLNTDECAVKFEKYIKPKNGNPSIAYKQYYEETSTGLSFRVSESLWGPELGVMPAKGLYYEFTPSANGDLLLALCIWRPKNHVYVFEKSTMTQFPTSALSVDGYANNNTVIWGTNTTAYTTMTMNDTHDYLVEGIPDKPMYGYMSLKDLEANKTYVLLSKDAQPGIYGFQFTPSGDPSGVETIKTEKVWNANAPMYNLSGQQVDKSYKGIVIQNGRKFVNK
jgi:hypothetical protein